MAAEGKLSHPGPGEEQAGEAAPREEAHEKLQHQGEEQLEVQAEEDHVVDEPPGQQMPGPPAAEHGQGHKVPVHQGQPEMWTHTSCSTSSFSPESAEDCWFKIQITTKGNS